MYKMTGADRIRNVIRFCVNYRVINFIRDRKTFFKDLKADYDALTGKTNYKYHNILIVGMSKSGTTRIENFLHKVSGYVPRPLYGDLKIITDQNISDDAFRYFNNKLYSYAKTHINPNENNISIINKKNLNKIILTIRDPRDAAVSRYFRALKVPKKKWETHSEVDYNDISKEDGIMHSLNVIKKDYMPWIDGWLKYYNEDDENRYIMMKYEDVLDDPVKKFKELSEFFEFDLATNDVKKYLDDIQSKMENGYSLKASRGNVSTFRKGIAGDWKNHFTEKHLEFVEKELKKDLVNFGYEV